MTLLMTFAEQMHVKRVFCVCMTLLCKVIWKPEARWYVNEVDSIDRQDSVCDSDRYGQCCEIMRDVKNDTYKIHWDR